MTKTQTEVIEKFLVSKKFKQNKSGYWFERTIRNKLGKFRIVCEPDTNLLILEVEVYSISMYKLHIPVYESLLLTRKVTIQNINKYIHLIK